MHLHQIKPLDVHERERTLHRFSARFLTACPNLCRKEELWLRPSFVVSSPITSSARPYMGEESISRPPRSLNRRSTSASCAACRWSAVRKSTSNVFQVPSPITGNCSLEDGIARVSIIGDSPPACACAVAIGKSNPAVVPPITRVASRRVIFGLSACSVNSESFLELASTRYNPLRWQERTTIVVAVNSTRRHF